MKKIISIFIFLLSLNSISITQVENNFKEVKEKYIQLSGELFEDVQLSGIFKDSKLLLMRFL